MIVASVIVAVYKDTQALGLILKALLHQSVENFEIIVAEDGEDPAMATFVAQFHHPRLIHTTQPDQGWRKNSSLNNAICHARGKLLIFVDGDCIPNHRFVESYLLHRAPHTILCGRRIELGAQTSRALRQGDLEVRTLEKSYLRRFVSLWRDGVRHYEEGIYSPLLHRLRHEHKESSIIGCNVGINTEDLIAINGFDEDYITPSIGEDTDIEWRLRHKGCTLRRVRNLAFVYHLDHARSYDATSSSPSFAIFAQVQANHAIVCAHGLSGHSPCVS